MEGMGIGRLLVVDLVALAIVALAIYFAMR
jgi:hypothetical protein